MRTKNEQKRKVRTQGSSGNKGSRRSDQQKKGEKESWVTAIIYNDSQKAQSHVYTDKRSLG